MRFLLALFMLLSAFAASQGQEDVLTAPGSSSFDSLSNAMPLVVGEVVISGNRTTKDFIIRRELMFRQGDTIPAGALGPLLDRSRHNLMNTSLFNFAELEPTVRNDSLFLRVVVVERWYLWPMPFFEIAETNFNTWWLTKDFRRTVYGMFISHDNFRGRKETVRLKFQLGYTRQFGAQYNIPYINKARTLGLSLTGSYYANKEITYATSGNTREFYKDTEEDVRNEYYFRAALTYRKRIFNTHLVQVKYNHATVQDTVAKLQPQYFPDGGTETQFLTLGYTFVRDKRDFKAYPLGGHLAGFDIIKHGSGLIEGEPDHWMLLPVLKKYWKFSEKWYLAAALEGKLSSSATQSYYIQRGLGYSDEIRGYGYYIIDGQHYGFLRSNLKFRPFPPGVRKLKLIPSAKFNTFHYAFYLNAFFDAGYVRDDQYFATSPLANTFLPGYGLGFDFVTYYDWVIRMEVSRNKLNETGFFINFTAPI